LLPFFISHRSPDFAANLVNQFVDRCGSSLIIYTSNNKYQNEIIKHVDSLLKLNEDLQTEKKQSSQDKVKQQITYHENQIDELVYQLYELTPEEIIIVAG
jgi:hypothetical protein